MSSNSDSKGFGLVGVLFVIVTLAVIGGAGVYVYHQDHKTKTMNNTSSDKRSSSHTTSNNSTTTSNPYSGWDTYTSNVAGYSIKYPSNWTVKSSTNNGGAEDTRITSPDNFEIELLSFAKTSSYGTNTFNANPTGACGSTCLASDTVASFDAPQYGSLVIDAQTQGADGGSINALGLYTSADGGYIASPLKAGVYTTVAGSFQGQSEQQNSKQTLTEFSASSSVQTAEMIYKSLAY